MHLALYIAAYVLLKVLIREVLAHVSPDQWNSFPSITMD